MTPAPPVALVAAQAPLPAEPPIGGPVWTIVVPAALFLVSLVATFLLYRHFAGREGGDR